MLSAQMQAVADEAVAKYKEAVERELQSIDEASDAKLEGKGEFSIHNPVSKDAPNWPWPCRHCYSL
jgi:hypothetical protein